MPKQDVVLQQGSSLERETESLGRSSAIAPASFPAPHAPDMPGTKIQSIRKPALLS